eukprot:CAMPEP_0170505190 /NCGR_PEP_ID=MMETSP0208-20121228/50117_1 /TAXON_ID=197538 /ORGANISM="Strombidium inclinatum, Strain S3" /LENGTH=77 /DNA_ID=CAMNT_0010785885 /DNA_START=362 /DNA_END=591 /DNA_ORIENTATION=-
MVLTCFDELIGQKGIVPIRGDLISNLSEDEGKTVMDMLLENYFMESKFQKVKQFNFDSANFKYQDFIDESLKEFAVR